jgi:N-glycosylase/DNA lyase
VTALVELELKGPAGEPVDFRRTLASHGVADLPPARVDEDALAYETTVLLAGHGPRTLRITEGKPGFARVEAIGPALPAEGRAALEATARRVLNLDEDLSPFYAAATGDPELAWAAGGAGRMLRSATVFEDVVKTICTTNCAWSATVRMTTALVEHLGEPAPETGRRAFPTPAAMAEADESLYREIVRAGYRGAYLRTLAMSVVSGETDLEALNASGPAGLSDEEVATALLGLPGVGPYAAAHMMMLLGRHSRLILDSWTRPKYTRLTGARRKPADRTIERRFRRYGPYAGLAFWLFLTRDWVAEPVAEPTAAS